jgi:putative transposase
MLQLKVNLSDLKEFAKSANLKSHLFSFVRNNLKETATTFLNNLMTTELNLFLGRDPYQRTIVRCHSKNLRNGHYSRSIAIKGLGKLEVKIPRDRAGQFKTQCLAPYKRIEGQLENDLALVSLTGLSTRTLSLLSQRLFGTKMSHEKISECAAKLTEFVESWRTRSLVKETFKYLYLDGTNFHMRISGKIEMVNVLVVIGVTKTGHKQVIALQAGDKESASSWRELFKDLKKRGLAASNVKLGIMDGLPGLEKVFKEEFKSAEIQRCQVHVARNVLSKVPQKMKQEVADNMRSVFYASTEKKAKTFFMKFKDEYQKVIPSAVKCLESSLKQTLTYLHFPKEEAPSLRTTNPIERINKEFKRRTKPMEIVAGESSCYHLLAVISIKTETYWKSKTIDSKVSLPWLNDIEFTHKS